MTNKDARHRIAAELAQFRERLAEREEAQRLKAAEQARHRPRTLEEEISERESRLRESADPRISATAKLLAGAWELLRLHPGCDTSYDQGDRYRACAGALLEAKNQVDALALQPAADARPALASILGPLGQLFASKDVELPRAPGLEALAAALSPRGVQDQQLEMRG